jgi:hypothetical protein
MATHKGGAASAAPPVAVLYHGYVIIIAYFPPGLQEQNSNFFVAHRKKGAFPQGRQKRSEFYGKIVYFFLQIHPKNCCKIAPKFGIISRS